MTADSSTSPRPQNPFVPAPIDMASTPIGPIPCTSSDGEVIRFPDYFEALKSEAGIAYKNSAWCIRIEEGGGSWKYDRFTRLQEAAKILVERWLYANGQKETAKKLSGMNRDDFLRTCLGMQNQIRVSVGPDVHVAVIPTMIDLRALTNSGILDWLIINSRDPKYVDKKRATDRLTKEF